jgi:porin-like protein GalP
LEDIYQQRYLRMEHQWVVNADTSVGAKVGYFHYDEDGKALAGPVDNRTVTGMFSLKTGPHSFYLGVQNMYGDSGWLRVAGSTAIDLPNDTFASSYDGAQERSWQVRYDFSFLALGIPGLTMMNRFVEGHNVHTTATSDGKERGRETEVTYVVQSGSLKNLSIRVRNFSLRQNYGTNSSFDENRVIIQYPFKAL